ncbi:MAG: hypothetical protein C4334_02920 [Pyrinomonas sp.]
MTECRRCREAIEATLPKRAPDERVRAHLSGCAACRAFYAERLALVELLRKLPRVEAPEDFEQGLQTALVTRSRMRPLRLLDPATVLASLAALSVTIALLLNVRWSPREKILSTHHDEKAVPLFFQDRIALIEPTETKTVKHKRRTVRARAMLNRPEIVAKDFAVKIAPVIETEDDPLVARVVEARLLNEAGEVQTMRIEPVSFGDETALKIIPADPHTKQQ